MKRISKKVICTICITCILCIGLLFFVLRKEKSEPEQGISLSETEQEQETGLQFPYEVEEGKLQINSLFQASVSNPDNANEYVENLAALEVVNISEEHLEEAKIVLTLKDGEKLEFLIEEIPAGKAVWVFESNNKSYELEQICQAAESDAAFVENTNLMNDELDITVDFTEVSVSNIKGEALEKLKLEFHCWFEDVYYGGRTYKYDIESLNKDESISLDVWECYMGTAEIVKIEK